MRRAPSLLLPFASGLGSTSLGTVVHSWPSDPFVSAPRTSSPASYGSVDSSKGEGIEPQGDERGKLSESTPSACAFPVWRSGGGARCLLAPPDLHRDASLRPL